MNESRIIQVLLIEDNKGDARLTRETLADSERIFFRVTHAESLGEAARAFAGNEFDVVLLDLSLPDAHGLSGISRLRALQRSIPIIVLTGTDDEEIAVDALQEGAQDYLVKGFEDGRQMGRAIRHAIERKKIEAMLVDSMERAEVANRTKSEFLAAMSHELRTPLNAIIGFSEVIKDEYFGEIGNPLYGEYCEDIYNSGVHLLGIINDILDLAKIESGNIELYEEDADINEILRSSARMVHERAEASGVRIFVGENHTLPAVFVDRRRVMQIFVNLLSNAIKFSPKGSKVSLTADLTGNGMLTVRVSDTGIGIAPDRIADALKPFKQVDSMLDRKFEGTGLGLPLSKQLIRSHGGDLSIESELGAGTTVTITFPPSRFTDREKASKAV